MERGMKTFAEALKRRKVRSARAKLDRIVRRLDAGDEYWQGYRSALEGMVAALESGDDLTFLRQVASRSNSRESIEKYIAEMQAKASQDFRPREEQGYHAAWVEILQTFLEMSEKNKKKSDQPTEA